MDASVPLVGDHSNGKGASGNSGGPSNSGSSGYYQHLNGVGAKPSRTNVFTLHLPNGSTHVIKMPSVVQWLTSVVGRRWKSLLFLSICLAVTIMGLNGAISAEWREITYYR